MFHRKNILNRMMHLTLLASLGFAAFLLVSAPALAATAPPLGNAATFSVLADLSMSAAGAGTTVSGDLGLSTGLAGSRTGPWTVGGTEYFGPLSLAKTAHDDALIAFGNLAGQASDGTWAVSPWSPTPGVWTAASDTTFAGTITLSGGYNDVWVFQVGRDMTFSGSVIMAGNAQPCNVFWQIGRDATIASGSTFVGTLIASRDVTVVSGATVDGRIISLNSSLTTDGNTISGPICVALATTTLSTQASSGVTRGEAISDTATLSGGATPTGTITFTLYGPDDLNCTGAVIFTSAVTVNGNGSYSSTPAFTPTTAGTYRWIANYSGDANNAATANACNAANENVVVKRGYECF